MDSGVINTHRTQEIDNGKSILLFDLLIELFEYVINGKSRSSACFQICLATLI